MIDISLINIYEFIKDNFSENKNITPTKILLKKAINMRENSMLLEHLEHHKEDRIKIKKLLNLLFEEGKLERKNSKQDFLGLKEISYKLKSY